jgi:aryl-alcohol dehydrogenase-like predicted oxidoreductase
MASCGLGYARHAHLPTEMHSCMRASSSTQEFKKLQEEGKIRYVGVSNETPFGVMKFCEMAEKLDLPKIVSIQNCYSLINRSVNSLLQSQPACKVYV